MELEGILEATKPPRQLPRLLVVDMAGRVHIVKPKRIASRVRRPTQLSLFQPQPRPRSKPGPRSERPALELAIGQEIPDQVWACLLKRRQWCRGAHPITLEAVLAEMRGRGILQDL